MNKRQSSNLGYFAAASLGALLGGSLVLLASHAIPKMMSRFMTQMMANMAEHMDGEGCQPSEI